MKFLIKELALLLIFTFIALTARAESASEEALKGCMAVGIGVTAGTAIASTIKRKRIRAGDLSGIGAISCVAGAGIGAGLVEAEAAEAPTDAQLNQNDSETTNNEE